MYKRITQAQSKCEIQTDILKYILKNIVEKPLTISYMIQIINKNVDI